MKCRVCGCTDADCSGCIERIGGPCSWVKPQLCSACAVTVGPMELVIAGGRNGDYLVIARARTATGIGEAFTKFTCSPAEWRSYYQLGQLTIDLERRIALRRKRARRRA